MCGISGVAGRIAGATTGLLAHRGPDGSAETRLDLRGYPTLLHHARLAIVDLTPAGDQPMTNEDGRFVMVFNGEIYNHLELRAYCESKGHTFTSRMDGEVILHLWEMEGFRCLSRLNGIFAVAIADTLTGELFLGRDPMGVKPLVYSIGPDGSIAFASEPSALAGLGADLGGPDVGALGAFLSFLWVPAPLTLFRNVRSLPVGQVLRWAGGEPVRMNTFRRIIPDPAAVTRQTLDEAVGELRNRIGVATQRQLLGDVPISVMASGGVDSSLVWDAAGGGVDEAFTIRWPAGSGEGSADDADAVARLEESLRTPVHYIDGGDAGHTYLPLSGDLYADPAFELTRLIAEASRGVRRKVLLSGQGGDELFGGYRRHMVAPYLGHAFSGRLGTSLPRLMQAAPGTLTTEFAARFLRATSHRDPFLRYMELCTYSNASERARVLGCTEAEVSDEVVFASHRAAWSALPSGLTFLRKMMAVDLGVYLPGLGLSYVDRAGMEFGVEIRVPWLDLDLVEWSFTLPDDLLVKRMKGKLVPKALARTVIPPEVVDRPKRGFGAPTNTLATGQQTAGSRGHRQGKYFALATDISNRWLEAAPASAGAGRR